MDFDMAYTAVDDNNNGGGGIGGDGNDDIGYGEVSLLIQPLV